RVARPGHGSRKLKDLLIAARVPLWRRPDVLVVGEGERVLGALGRGFVHGGGEPAEGWLWLESDSDGAVGNG
ncbi:MAG TPA: tRNA lysidine(34) synthetase TilS, partial [Deferrisomatales bacterium]|nr:tRNA lysidine(34) synthetase TilS [Deferrisomatales bacterium]